MNIIEIKKLDVGVSGLTCSGTIKYVLAPRNITGEKGGKPYDFWTQFVVIEDDTDSIGANIRIGGADQKLQKGYKYTLKDCKLDSYVKDGETKLSLQGRVSSGNAPQGSSQAAGTSQATKDVDWDAKDLRMARMNALTNATKMLSLFAEAGRIDPPSMDLLTKTTELLVGYIYHGLQKGGATPNPAMSGEDYGPPDGGKVPEDDIPF